MKSDDNPDLEDGELEDGELEEQEEDAPATPPAAPEIPAPSASTSSSVFKESHEEIDAKVFRDVATEASVPLYKQWFRCPGSAAGSASIITKRREKARMQRALIAKYVDHDRLIPNEEYYNVGFNKEDDFAVQLQKMKMLQRKEQSELRGPYDSPSDDDDLDNEEALQSKKIRAGNGEPSTSEMDGGDRAALDSSGDESPQSNNQPAEGGKRKRDKFTDCAKLSEKRRLADTPWEERPLCRFYIEGKCSKGSDCKFNHSGKPEKQELPPCKQFLRTGTCHYGDNCKYSHSPNREEVGKMPVLANGVGDGDHPAPKKRTLLDEPPLEKKKKIQALLDIELCPEVSDPDKQFCNFDFPDGPPPEKKRKVQPLLDLQFGLKVADPESIQKTLKEAAQKSVYGQTKHQSPVMRQHVPQGVRKPGLLDVAPKNMMGPGSMMSAARSMPFCFSNESSPSNRHGNFGFQTGRMFNFNEQQQQQQQQQQGQQQQQQGQQGQQQQQPNWFGIDRVPNNDGWQQQQQPLFSEHPTVPQEDATIQTLGDHVSAGSPSIDDAKSGYPMDQADDKVGLLNCDDNVQMSNNEQVTSTKFVLDKDERRNVNKDEKMIVDTDQKEETSAKVDENAAQLASSVDEMKPVKEKEEGQRYLGGFDLYSLHPAQRIHYRKMYQKSKSSAVDAATKMGEKSSAIEKGLLKVDVTIRLPLSIDLTDPKWENDPRVQKHKNDKPILDTKPMPAPIMPQQNAPAPPSVPTSSADPRIANRYPRRAKTKAKEKELPPVQSSSNPPLMQVEAVSSSHQQQQQQQQGQQQQQQAILGAAPPVEAFLPSVLSVRPNTALHMNMLLNSMEQVPQVQDHQQDMRNNVLRSMMTPSGIDPSLHVNTSVNNIMPRDVGGVSKNPDSCSTKDVFVRPTMNYRQDSRLRKKATRSAAAQSSGELENRQEKSSSNSEQPEVGKKSLHDMNITEYRSPLRQRSPESSSAISGYGRPPNKKYEEMTAERNQKCNHKGANKTFGNLKHETRNIGQQFVAPTLPAMPMMAVNQFVPPQPEGSVKDMFKTRDPTASPFC